ncbi:MAG: hypothetical protein R6W90_03055 [Ignavibacteriaceae bacterium]
MKNNLFALLFSNAVNNGDLSESNITVGNQNILFEVEYKNFAWGYMHSGFYVNKYGEIFSYKYDHNSDLWEPNPDGLYSEQDLLDKYRPNKRLLKNIDYREVAVKKELIPRLVFSDTSIGRLGEPGLGTLSYICYLLDFKKRKYKEIIMHQEGDWNFKKQSTAADSLVVWLKQVTNFFGKRP